MSLFWRILGLNALVLGIATALPLWAPVTVSVPVLLTEAMILVGGLAVMLVANGTLLRWGLAPLDRLGLQLVGTGGDLGHASADVLGQTTPPDAPRRRPPTGQREQVLEHACVPRRGRQPRRPLVDRIVRIGTAVYRADHEGTSLTPPSTTRKAHR